MPNGNEIKDIGKILTMIALNYEKQEIAEELDVSRNTVRNRLIKFREFAESSKQDEQIVVAYACLDDACVGR